MKFTITPRAALALPMPGKAAGILRRRPQDTEAERPDLGPVIAHPAPRRIMIVGGSGAGKSRLALRLAKRLGLPLHHADALCYEHLPGAGRQAALGAIAAQDSWILDSNSASLYDHLFDRAELVIHLDIRRRRRIFNWMLRHIRYMGRRGRPGVHPARREPIGLRNFHIPWFYHVRTAPKLQRKLARRRAKVVRISSYRQLDGLVARVEVPRGA